MDVEAPGDEWERLNHGGGESGSHNKPYRLRCIRAICSRVYPPGPDDDEEEVLLFCVRIFN